MNKIRILVTVPKPTPAKLKSVKTELFLQGVEIDSVLETLGIIAGTVAESRLPTLRPGAENVIEVDEPVQLPSPDDPLQ
jgi:hypothetical protein